MWPALFQGRVGPGFILAHESAEAHHIGGQNGGQATLGTHGIWLTSGEIGRARVMLCRATGKG